VCLKNKKKEMHRSWFKNGSIPPRAGLRECTPEARKELRALGFLIIAGNEDKIN
jgi:hypothetical protein